MEIKLNWKLFFVLILAVCLCFCLKFCGYIYTYTASQRQKSFAGANLERDLVFSESDLVMDNGTAEQLNLNSI